MPRLSQVQLKGDHKFVRDKEGRIWARQEWVDGSPELRWEEESIWFVWGDYVPDILT